GLEEGKREIARDAEDLAGAVRLQGAQQGLENVHRRFLLRRAAARALNLDQSSCSPGERQSVPSRPTITASTPGVPATSFFPASSPSTMMAGPSPFTACASVATSVTPRASSAG